MTFEWRTARLLSGVAARPPLCCCWRAHLEVERALALGDLEQLQRRVMFITLFRYIASHHVTLHLEQLRRSMRSVGTVWRDPTPGCCLIMTCRRLPH